MAQAIFLSASVPDPRRAPDFAATADTVAIASAVSALLNVTLGRRLLVWGGHPAITPMVWVVAEDTGVDYEGWVRLYQSLHFENLFPDEIDRFSNVTYTEDIDRDREKSLLHMRERMLSDFDFTAAVFIGGMEGIMHEFEIVRKMQPEARLLPVASTGGAALEVAQHLPDFHPDLENELDYIALFHRHLEVSVNEMRFTRPEEQPEMIEDRLYRFREGTADTEH